MENKVKELCKVCDQLADVKEKTDKAKSIIYDLLEEYYTRDDDKMRDKISCEAPRLMNYIDIVGDYMQMLSVDIDTLGGSLNSQLEEARGRKELTV